MSDTDASFEQAQAYQEVVERLWVEPLFEVCRNMATASAAGTVLVAESRCGFVALELAPHLEENSRLMALDPHGAMLDVARERAERREGLESIFFVNQRVADLSYAADVFGTSLCLDGLLTARQAQEGIAELARVTAEEGALVVGVPLANCFAEFYDILDEAMRAHRLDDALPRIDRLKRSLISPGRLAGAAHEAGLEDISIEKLSWEVAFESGRDFLDSPLIRQSFFPHWIGLVRSTDREPVMRHVCDAIDTYWHARQFSTTVHAAVLVGTC